MLLTNLLTSFWYSARLVYIVPSPLLVQIPRGAIGLPPSLGSSGGSWLSLLSQALRRSQPKSCAFPPEMPPPGSWAPPPGLSLLSALLLLAAVAAPAVGAVSLPGVARAPSSGGDGTLLFGCPSQIPRKSGGSPSVSPRSPSCRGGSLSGVEMASRFAAGSDTGSSCAAPHEQVSPASLSPSLARSFVTPLLLLAILPNPPVGSADPRCMGGSQGSGGSRNPLPAAGSEFTLVAPASGGELPPLLHMWSRLLRIFSCAGQVVAGHGFAQSSISGRR